MKKTQADTETRPTLPDDLVTKIIAMMPFPSVFKARNLSKAWRYRFSPVATREDNDEDEKRIAASFQADVRERTKSLGTFFPVSIDKEICVTYDWASRNWVRLPSLSFLPEYLLDGVSIRLHGRANPGLVFVTKTGPNMEEQFIVANIFTQTWKLLPPRPGLRTRYPGFRYWKGGRLSERSPRLVQDSSTGQYKVIAFAQNRARVWFANIYDSRRNAWSLTKLVKTLSLPCSFAYLNGVLYMVNDNPALDELFTLTVEEGTKEIIPLRCSMQPEITSRCTRSLVVLDGQLFMLLFNVSRIKVLIMKVDLESRQLLEISRGPPNLVQDDLHDTLLASIQGSLFLFERRSLWTRHSTGHFTGPIVAYDLLKDEWTWLKFPPNSTISLLNRGFELLTRSDGTRGLIDSCRHCQDLIFEPGLDPFWQV